MRPFLFAAVLILGSISCAVAWDNGLGRVPQMAWNSWNTFGCNINETIVMQTANIIVKLGLNKVGYQYVNIDDCWAYSRNASGFVQPDPKTFPSGIKALADYVHSLGLKFGLYSDAGYETCAGRPGSLGYEKQDAEQYAAWGVDYLKYDDCNHPSNLTDQTRYTAMHNALNATGHPIFYSLCNGYVGTAIYGPYIANSWRTTIDIGPLWESWTNNIDESDVVAKFAAPGGWNDPDMLEVGNGELTPDQNQAHFALWALAKAPLILGNDLRIAPQDVLDVLMNQEIIAINQDPLGVQGTRLTYSEAQNANVFGNILYADKCDGSSAQQFEYTNSSLVSKLTGLCVGQFSPTWACSMYGPALGAALYLQPCNQLCGGKFQKFSFNSQTGAFQSNFTTWSECVEAFPTNYSSQADVRLWQCNPSTEQTWSFTNGAIQNTVGQCITVSRGDEVWAAPQSDGSHAVVLFNRASVAQNVTLPFSVLGIEGSATVRDLWAHQNLGTFSTSFTTSVNPQGVATLKVASS